MNNKEIQRMLLEILKSIDAICRNEKLSYMLTQGTLLGAVREKGFIEWDIEDADIMMYRKDFNSFITYYSAHSNDLKFFLGYDGAGLVPRLMMKENPEIFVEIVLIDFLSKIKWKRKLKIFMLRLTNAMMRTHNSYANHTMAHNIMVFMIWCFGRVFDQNTKCNLYSKISQFANDKKSSFIHFSNECSVRMVFEFDRRLLEETVRIPFEDTVLSAPREWDTVLKFYYGNDYMIPKRDNYKVEVDLIRI